MGTFLLSILVLASIPLATGTGEERKLPASIIRAIENASDIQLLSLHPDSSVMNGDKQEKLTTFHGYPVFDKGSLKKEDTRKLLDTVKRLVEESDGTSALCFIPHHGIRIKQGETTMDLVICFLCLQMKVYVDDRPPLDFTISADPQPVLNLLFDRSRVKRVKSSK